MEGRFSPEAVREDDHPCEGQEAAQRAIQDERERHPYTPHLANVVGGEAQGLQEVMGCGVGAEGRNVADEGPGAGRKTEELSV